ncbi:MAG TPA: hypothetical protein VGN12_12020 [Pirellulales bacterium]|jgi:hypothetical protein
MGSDGSEKFGEGHLKAMGRQGLNELRAAVYTGSNIAQQPEYGLYGTPTPGEIADARRINDRDFEQDDISMGGEQDYDIDLDGPDDPGIDME